MRRLILLTLLLTGCTAASPLSNPQTNEPLPPSIASSSGSSETTTASGSLQEYLTDDGLIALGADDAPVTITLVTHPSCTYCRDAQTTILPGLQSEYIQSNRVRLRVMILDIKKYAETPLLRQAVICSGQQNRGMTILDALFHLESKHADAILAAATQAGLNETRLTNCIGGQPFDLSAQDAYAAAKNITLVPTFVVNDTVHTGLPEYADVRGWIEDAERRED